MFNLFYGTGVVAVLVAIFAFLTPSEPTPIPVTNPVSTPPITEQTVETEEMRTAVPVQQAVSEPDTREPSIATPQPSFYPVIKVIDGDTITVNINGSSETIRFIGIDTPETVDPRKTVQCFGKEASDKTKVLLSGKKVTLENDPSQGERDKYGRLLAYVMSDDGVFVNKYLVEEGYAYEYTYNLPYKYQAEFKAAQKSAEVGERGLWAPGVCEEKSESTPSSQPVNQPQPTYTPPPSTSGYSCSANTYNCGDFSTHAEAQNVYEMCGGVTNDIHRLDADKDGEACESLP